MKYLKLFEDVSIDMKDKGYKPIYVDHDDINFNERDFEWYKDLASNMISIDEKTCEDINKIIKDDFEIVYNTITNIGGVDTVKSSIRFALKGRGFYSNNMCIYQCEDEWFILTIRNPNDLYIYICDQLFGLENLLKDKGWAK